MRASLVAQKNLSAMHETRVQSLGHADPLEKGMATYSSILVWRISWTEELGRLQSMGSQGVGRVWMTNTHTWVHSAIQHEFWFYCGWNTKNLKQLLLRKIQMHDRVRYFQYPPFFLYSHANIQMDQWLVTEVASVTLRELTFTDFLQCSRSW